MATLKSSPNQVTAAKALASFVILTVISIQSYAAILHRVCSRPIPLFCALPKEPGLYPFLDYPMYKTAHLEGESIDNYALIGVFADNTQKQLAPSDFGLSLYQFNRGLVEAVKTDNLSKIRDYTSAYNQISEPPFVQLQLENRPLVITADGVKEGVKAEVNRTPAASPAK